MEQTSLQTLETVAEVAVDKTAFTFDAAFEYIVPAALKQTLRAGMRVVVPFGRGGGRRMGLVLSVEEKYCSNLKQIFCAADSEPVISDELVRLCRWIKENTFCTYYDAFRAILPPGLGFTLSSHYTAAENFEGELTEEQRGILSFIRTCDRQEADELIAARIASGQGAVIRDMIKKGALAENNTLKRKVGDMTLSMLRPLPFDEDIKLTPKQRAVVDFVKRSESASIKEVCYACAVTSAVINRLTEKGVLEKYERQVFRTEPSDGVTQKLSDIRFSPKQREVFDGLLALMNSPKPECALLRGVTGSGKTSIFIKLIEQALLNGKTAVMLVPEISLTPQMVSKFRGLFGADVAVMHSSLSLGERADEYRRIKLKKARIVIGTRSAVFAPMENIGIIVIDEEGEGSYKSESAPRYHARDIAKQRCFAHNAFLLLASATPSLESYYYAKTGRYSLFELDERYNSAVLPDVYMVDMRIEAQNGNHSSFGEPLIEALTENLKRGEQSILLLNRRGYHTGVRCARCGAVEECPNCSIPLTYHKANESMICHYCGYLKRVGGVCKNCGSKLLIMNGTGTQRIEDEISQLFPTARVLRMDADTTMTKNAYETKFRAFAEHRYDIIVGTQMIAKGLNFPDVTLVGVLKTDNSLYAGDFRAYERTFSLITQVVGRSGRGDKRGRAFLQTFSPEHHVLLLAANQNYKGFYEEEIQLREALVYPPFCDICVIGFTSPIDEACFGAARKFREILENNRAGSGFDIPMRILGPAKNYIGKINGRYRYRLVVKCRNGKKLRAVIAKSLTDAGKDKAFTKTAFYADMNGEVI